MNATKEEIEKVAKEAAYAIFADAEIALVFGENWDVKLNKIAKDIQEVMERAAQKEVKAL